MTLFALVPSPWQSVLEPLRTKIDSIGDELRKRADSGERILPDRDLVFRALQTPPEEVNVVLVGQDPYPNLSDACGLAFSIKPRTSNLPASLMNIQKEIITDIGSTMTADGDLSRWSDQGVLLLNRVLTVKAGESASHNALGWQEITRAIVAHAATRGALGLLWGAPARELAPLFQPGKVVEGVHPSPLSAHRGFLGSKPFSRINSLLIEIGKEPIQW